MPAVKSSFEYSVKGVIFGAKVNTKGTKFGRAIKGAIPSGVALLNDMSTLLRNRVDSRLDLLRKNFKEGAPGAMGTIQYESSPRKGHTPHEEIPNPLSLIIDHGMKYRMTGTRGALKLEVRPYKTRKRIINFHKKMPKTPRVEFILKRFDQTCLPYMASGNMQKIFDYWGANTVKAFNRDLNKYIEDKNKAFKESVDKTKAGK